MLRERRGLRMLSALGPVRSFVVILALLFSLGWLVLAIVVGVLPAGNGLSNRLGGTIAGDFQFFYAAGSLAARGDAAGVYDPVALTAEGRRTLGPNTPDLVWPYPPTMSLPLALLGVLSPKPAVVAWIGLLVFALLAQGRLILGRWRAAPVALLCPASGLALFTGQFSPVLALLMCLFITFAERSVAVAGTSLGLFVLKPHLGLISAAFSLTPRLRKTLLVAAATGLSVVALSVAVFGAGAWSAFLNAGLHHTSVLDVEAPMARFVTPFATARSFGASVGAALAIHAVVAMMAIALGWRLWTRDSRASMRALGLTTATLLAVPYALDYDLVLLVIPWLLMGKEGYEDSAAVRGLFPSWLALTCLVPISYLVQLYSGRTIASPLLLGIVVGACRTNGVWTSARHTH